MVGEDYEVLGFINEGDLIRAMEAGIDLKKATAIMNTAFIGMKENTTLSCGDSGRQGHAIHYAARSVTRASGTRPLYR